MSYRPELYVSPFLNPKEAQEYQQFIGIARWIIELGRVDIRYEVFLQSSHLDMTHKVNIEVLMGILVYLENAYVKTIIIDPMILEVDIDVDWNELA